MAIIVFVISTVLVIIDQITKKLAAVKLEPMLPNDVPLINGWLHLHYHTNTGAAFGMFSNMRWLFISVSIVFVIVFMLVVILKKVTHPIACASVALIIAGGIGNLIDRIFVGYVVDFIYVKIIDFAIFNVADMCVCVGAFLLGYYVLFVHGKEPKDGKKADGYGDRIYGRNDDEK